MRASQLLAVVALTLTAGTPFLTAFAGDEPVREEIELFPDEKVGWTMRNFFAPVTGLFLGGPSYWYEPRRIDIDTTPPGGNLDLFYVRSNFQKRFEQAQAPITLVLPPRIEGGPRDAITVRAFREGYRPQELSFRLTSREKQLQFDLSPLPNTLEVLSHRYFMDRSTLGFYTKEMLEFRVTESADGFTVILNETARGPQAVAAMEGIRSPMIEEVLAQQLGEDLLVNVILSPQAIEAGFETRSRQGVDAARDLYLFAIDVLPKGAPGSAQKALAALAKLEPSDVSGCAEKFEERVRAGLDPGALNRALTPNGDFTDKYVRAAMRRLGELTPGGAVPFDGGARYDTRVPIELEVALSQAGGAHGLIALLRAFVGELEAEEYRAETLRSLIAPEASPEEFESLVGEASKAEKSCLAGG